MQAEVPVRHDRELEAQCPQPVERFDDARKHVEVQRADVGRHEFIRGEARVDRLEEDADALPLQSRQALLVVSLACARSVVRDLGLEAGQDCFGGPLDSTLREGARQRGNRIGERDECSMRIERDRIEVAGLHATHCHSAHCTTAMPRNSAPQATTALCKRGLAAVSDASARKSGKMTSPKRGRESRGQRELG